MNTQKLIFAALGLGVIVGFGFLVMNLNSKVIKEGNAENPIKFPVLPLKTSVNQSGELNKDITLKLNDKITFSDGLTVVLKEINDSRCTGIDVECMWQGELSAVLELSGGKLATSKEIRLGTVNNTSVSVEGYIFYLNNATENNITILLRYENLIVPVGACYVGGCSGEICSDQKDVISTCMYKEEYACYKTATCEKQTTGQCGWTQTAELQECLSK